MTYRGGAGYLELGGPILVGVWDGISPLQRGSRDSPWWGLGAEPQKPRKQCKLRVKMCTYCCSTKKSV